MTPGHRHKAKLVNRCGRHQMLLVFGIKNFNLHIQILNLASINYFQVKRLENIDPVVQKTGIIDF